MNQPPQWGQQPGQQPQWGQPTQPVTPPPPGPPRSGPRWARKRIVIPAAAVLFFIGVGIGASGGGDSSNTSSATPAPTVTVTTKAANAKAAPAPTVTVTKTVTVKPAAKKTTAAPTGKAVFKVWGSAPSGVDITYGSDGENIAGHGLPMTKTLTVKDDAMYYAITAQLSGGGDIHCSVTIDGNTKTGHASGGYNICSAQLNGDFSGGFS
jgi:hypothetical protein